MDEHENPTNHETEESDLDNPINLIPKSVLDFKPRVADIPDYHRFSN